MKRRLGSLRLASRPSAAARGCSPGRRGSARPAARPTPARTRASTVSTATTTRRAPATRATTTTTTTTAKTFVITIAQLLASCAVSGLVRCRRSITWTFERPFCLQFVDARLLLTVSRRSFRHQRVRFAVGPDDNRVIKESRKAKRKEEANDSVARKPETNRTN